MNAPGSKSGFWTNVSVLGMPIILWAAIVSSSYSWNLEGLKSNTHDLALERGRMVHSVVKAARMWNASHGVVYAPETDRSPSNPYLHVPEQDIVTPGGTKLTVINPSYMVRQISDILNTGNVKISIASLRPINPVNTPTDWEREVLHRFERGERELVEQIETEDGPVYAYMAPLVVKPPCINCHTESGYDVGDIRGGIRVSFPTSTFGAAEETAAFKLLNVHLIVFALLSILSTTAIAWTRRLISNLQDERDQRDAIIDEKTHALRNEIAVKNRLFSIISHDLKSPFTALLGMTKIMSSMGDRFEKPKLIDYAHDVHSAGEHIFELVHTLLDWSRLQMDGSKFEPRDSSAYDLIQTSINVLKPAAANKHQELTITGSDINIHVDHDMFQSVIRNLLGNAIKFTPEAGQINIHIEPSSENDFAAITVSDTGTGISPGLIDDIFAIDKKTTTQGTQGEVGTGLGLPLTKELVERNGGTIWVETSKRHGTQFSFTVPLAEHQEG